MYDKSMKRTFASILLLVLALAACAPVGTPTTDASATTPAQPGMTPMLGASTTPVATVAANSTAGADGTVSPDCSRYPGFGACQSSLALTGRLAVYDSSRGIIDILDLRLKLAWQVPAGAGVKRLAWVDNGNFLITYGAENKPTLAWTFPATSKSPDLSLSPNGTPLFSSTSGTAWLEQKDGQYIYHTRLGSDKEQTWLAEPKASDKLHELLGWVPGTTLLLAGYHYSSNSMWVTGNQLYTLDARNGAIKELNASLKLNNSFAWNPAQVGLLAFGDSLHTPVMGAPRLAVLDVLSGNVTHPVADEAVSSAALAWTPDGKAILHAASKVGEAPKAGDAFALAAIYQTAWPEGTTTRLTAPLSGWRDSWPQPLDDGKWFLYARYNSETKQAELRVGSLDGKTDALLSARIEYSAVIQPTGERWEAVLAYTR